MALKTCVCSVCGQPAETDEFDATKQICIDCAYDAWAINHMGEEAWHAYVEHQEAEAAAYPDYGPNDIGLIPPTG